MKKKITLIKYDNPGNIGSLINLIKNINLKNNNKFSINISKKAEIIKKSDILILPGVGQFDEVMSFLNKNRINSVGISGLSGNMIKAEIANKELGLVGEIKNLNINLIESLLNDNYVPVISPIGLNQSSINENDSILNINADFVASEIARNLKADKLIYQTDVDGIRDGKGRIISKMTLAQAKDLINSGIVVGGMLPKLESCINSMQGVDRSHIINGSDNSLIEVFKGNRIGTEIIN